MNLAEAFFLYCNKITEIYPKLRIKQIEISNETLSIVKDTLGFELPAVLKEWFSLIGEGDFGLEGFLFGLEAYTIENMLEEWKSWREFDDDQDLNDSSHFSSKPAGAIKCRYTTPLWIPLAHDYASNYLGVDLGPDARGVAGQIINFGRDENDKVIYANSLCDLLELGLRFQDEMQIMTSGEVSMYINKSDEHPLDWLKQKMYIN